MIEDRQGQRLAVSRVAYKMGFIDAAQLKNRHTSFEKRVWRIFNATLALISYKVYFYLQRFALTLVPEPDLSGLAIMVPSLSINTVWGYFSHHRLLQP